MTIRQRKLIGAVLLLVLVIVWSLVGVAIAQAPVLKDNRLWQFVFYIVAGPWLGAAGDAADQVDVEGVRSE